MDPALQGFLEDDYPRVVAALALMCGSRPIAEDAVAEALSSPNGAATTLAATR